MTKLSEMNVIRNYNMLFMVEFHRKLESILHQDDIDEDFDY